MFQSLSKLLTLLVLFGSQLVWADPAVYLNDAGVALSGNDPVAYFTVKSQSKAKPSSVQGIKMRFIGFLVKRTVQHLWPNPANTRHSMAVIAPMQLLWGKKHLVIHRSGRLLITSFTSTTTPVSKSNG